MATLCKGLFEKNENKLKESGDLVTEIQFRLKQLFEANMFTLRPICAIPFTELTKVLRKPWLVLWKKDRYQWQTDTKIDRQVDSDLEIDSNY